MTPLDEAWRLVCENERLDHYREMEPALARVAAAIVSGWEPPLARSVGVARRRGAYLIDALRMFMDDRRSRAWTERLDALSLDPQDGPPAAFWHGDRRLTGNDDLARRWGLSRGLELGRLRHAIALAASA